MCSLQAAREAYDGDVPAGPLPWRHSDDTRVTSVYHQINDLFAAAEAVSRSPNHAVFRLFELIPRSKLVRLSADKTEQASVKHTAAKSSGTKRGRSDFDDGISADIACTICRSRANSLGEPLFPHCVPRGPF